MEPIYEPVEGQYGDAAPLTVLEEKARGWRIWRRRPRASETVCMWLVNAPVYHPAWSQYVLLVVRLTDGMPGYPPPHHQFEGTTHELLVMVLDPEKGRQTVESVDALHAAGKSAPYLMSPNVVEQFIATDAEMRAVAFLCSQAVVRGQLNPDTDGRSGWLPAITKTLAHIRGEAHAP